MKTLIVFLVSLLLICEITVAQKLINRGPGLFLDPYTGRYLHRGPYGLLPEPGGGGYSYLPSYGLQDFSLPPEPEPEYDPVHYVFDKDTTVIIQPRGTYGKKPIFKYIGGRLD